MLRALLLTCIGAGFVAAAAADDKKAGEKRSGTVIGLVTAKEKAMIEIKADGEEKGRRYVPHWTGGLPKDGGGPDKKLVEAIGKVKVGSRVRIEWEFEERPRVLKIEVLKAPDGDKSADKDEQRGGTVTGKVTDKAERWIEITADGEEKGRRYYLAGKAATEIQQAIKDAPIDSRVRIEWTFNERPRVVKLEVLKK